MTEKSRSSRGPVIVAMVLSLSLGFGFPDDVAFARWLVSEIGVAAVPGSSFYSDPAAGRQRLRFHFARRLPTLEAAVERLTKVRAQAPAGAARA